MTLRILKHRWTLFGHILRLSPNTPARLVMHQYFTNPTELQKHLGKPKTNIVTQLNQDLQLIRLQLRSIDDYNQLGMHAQDRNGWRSMIERIMISYQMYQDSRHETQRNRRRQKRLSARINVEQNGAPKIFRIFFRDEEPQPEAMDVEDHNEVAEAMEVEDQDNLQDPLVLRLPRALFD